MKTNDYEQTNGTRPNEPRTQSVERQMHILDELYRLAGLAPVHAYQAALADLKSLHDEKSEPR